MKDIVNCIKKYSIFIWLLIITFIGFFLRLKIGLANLANDEVATVATAAQSFPAGILNALETKNLHAPLFYFILHFWIKLFGEDIFILRLLPIILGTACIPIAYMCAKELHSKYTGILTSVLVSVNFFMISYSHFCKFYALLQLLGFISIYFLIKFDKEKSAKKYLYMLAITNALIIYTYVIGFLFVFTQIALYLLYRIKVKQDKNIKFTIPYLVTLGILTFPIVPFLLKVIQNTQSSVFPTFVWYEFKPEHIQSALLSWFCPAVSFIFQDGARTDATQTYFATNPAYFILFTLIPLGIAIYGLMKTVLKKDLCTYILYSALLFVIAELIGAIAGKFSFCSRGAMVCFPSMIIAIGYGLAQIKTKNLALLLAVVYAYTGISFLSAPVLSIYNTRPSEIFKMSEIMNKFNLQEGDSIIIPVRGYYFQKYYNTSQVNFISYDINYSFKTNDRRIIDNIFDKDDIICGKNIIPYKKFEKYLDDYRPSKALTRDIKNRCIDKIKTGHKVYMITYNAYDAEKFNWYIEAYKDNIYKLLATKLNYDLEEILDKNLTKIQIVEAENFKITVYEK